MICQKPVRGGLCFKQRGHIGACKARKSSDNRVIEMSRVYVPGVDNDPRTLEEAKLRIEHLSGEILMLQKAMEPMGEMRRGFDAMQDDTNAIALFLRENMGKEIERGYHAGRTLGQIVVGYLGELTEMRVQLSDMQHEKLGYISNSVQHMHVIDELRNELSCIPRWVRRVFSGHNHHAK